MGSRSMHSAREGMEQGVADLMGKLNLTADEEAVADFSDDELVGEEVVVEWVLIGKVLSPTTVHVNTVLVAMRPACGKPFGLKGRSVGEKRENHFIVEFGNPNDKARALEGSPWMVGKHAVVLQEYVEKLKPSDISFERMAIWVRILNTPFGWMNAQHGMRVMNLIGKTVKMDVNADGKASGAYLRGRVEIDVNKPIRRGVMFKIVGNKPEWFVVQYEKLSFYRYSCGLIGHREIECIVQTERNSEGKLPYDLPLRASDHRRRRMQNFAQAAAESLGQTSSDGSWQARSSSSRSGDGRNLRHGKTKDKTVDDEEVCSPIRPKGHVEKSSEPGAAHKLFKEIDRDGGKKKAQSKGKAISEEAEQMVRKRKSKSGGEKCDYP
ncbi:hypothetical protein QOZ80_8AG0627820 [Eleusine coracana subsp. coracana]|nr:hypothetical protein QOZ80_8AG0627820 [Eleusine coracana subsp. coracana]